MADFLLSILASAATGALLSAAVAWLCKSWISERLKAAIQHEYNEKLETFKIKLQADSAIEMEKLRSQLNVNAAERQIQFTGLYETRGQVITHLYNLLVVAHREGTAFASPILGVYNRQFQERYQSTHAAIIGLVSYFDAHRIYIPLDLCMLLEQLIYRLRNEILVPVDPARYDEANLPEHIVKQRHVAAQRAWEYFDKEFPGTRGALEHEFRKLLGDPSTIPAS